MVMDNEDLRKLSRQGGKKKRNNRRNCCYELLKKKGNAFGKDRENEVKTKKELC